EYVHQLATKNVIFQQRTRGVGVVTRENAISWGWTGPVGRASGLNYDVRRAHPYGGYQTLDFDGRGASVRRLRDARLRRAGAHRGRHLLALHGAHGGDAAEPAHHPPDARPRH